MQVSASRGGECAVESNEKNDEVIATGLNSASALWEDNTATFCWSEADFASG